MSAAEKRRAKPGDVVRSLMSGATYVVLRHVGEPERGVSPYTDALVLSGQFVVGTGQVAKFYTLEDSIAAGHVEILL